MSHNTSQIVELDSLRNIDFTALDYDSIQSELIDYIQTSGAGLGLQDDFLDSSAGRVFIDLISYLGHILAFRIDTVAREAYLPTAIRRQNIINLLKLIGVGLTPPKASQLTMQLIPSTIPPADINIPSRFQIPATGLDGNTVTFEIMNDATDYFTPVIINAGSNTAKIIGYEGTYQATNFVSNGQPNQSFTLDKFPVIDGSIKVSVTPITASKLTPEDIENSRVVEVDSLITPSSDIIFKVEYDADNKATLTFASEKFGTIPPLGYTIHVDYRTGGGLNGNVTPGSVNFSTTLTDESGNSISVVISNPDTEAAGGDDAETIDSAKEKAPLRVRTNFKLVTLEDYRILMTDIPGIQDILAIDYLTDKKKYGASFGVPVNSIYIWVLPTTGGEISLDMRQIIASYVDERRLTAIDHFIFDPIYNNQSLNAKIFYSKFTGQADLEVEIRNTLDEEFGTASSGFGKEIRLSHVLSTIQTIKGVKYVQLTAPNMDLIPSPYEVIRILPSMVTLSFEKVS